jgi:hypothetical protein
MTRTTSTGLGLALAALAGACGADDPTIIDREHTGLVQYESCADLEKDLKASLRQEIRTRFDQARNWQTWGYPGTVDDANGPPESAGGDTRDEGTDYSGTNNQEEGVDESDFLKTDGYHIYTINGNALHILGVPQFGQLVPESVTNIEGWPQELLVNKDSKKAIVFSSIDAGALPEGHPLRNEIGYADGTGAWQWRVTTVSKLTVLDVSTATAPRTLREIYLEGWYQAARMIDSTVRLGAYSWINVPYPYYYWYGGENGQPTIEEQEQQALALVDGLSLDDLIPRAYERTLDEPLARRGLTSPDCSSVSYPTNSAARGFTTLLSLDLASDGHDFDTDQVVTNYANLYASKDYLYVAEPSFDWWWFWWNNDEIERTNIHAFDISQPGQTQYLGSGRIDGTLHNTFSLSEHEGYLRAATTVNFWNRWWLNETPPAAENHVFVLGLEGNELKKVGHLGNLARGERIFAARMTGTRGYLVTFQQIDPLFTLDLSDPRNPRVAGELEIFGFSSYIHPIAGDKLLTIGVGGDENGANWRTQISMFDVANFGEPSLTDVEQLVPDGTYGWSEAMYEHKAFQYFAPKGLLAVPLSSYRDLYDEETGYYSYEYTSKLHLISVDPATGLASHGEIDHSGFYNSDPEQYWMYTDIRRSIFMGDFVYAVSDRGITVHRTGDLGLVASEPLPGYTPYNYYWWW